MKETVRGGVPIAASAYGMGEAEYGVAWEGIQHSGFLLHGNFSALRDYKAERFLKETARLV